MKERIIVAVDAMGGDNAPAVEVEAVVTAARQWGLSIILVGDLPRIESELRKHRTEGLDISLRHASEVVGMHDSASDAIRKKKDSSIRVAFDLVKTGEAHAVVSAGNSGATMAAGMFVLKRVRGIDRPAIATIFPNLKDQTLVLDVGGNVDCKPFHLSQFALMGEVYARHVLGKLRPRVGMLSNGEEESKGTELTREAHTILRGLAGRMRNPEQRLADLRAQRAANLTGIRRLTQLADREGIDCQPGEERSAHAPYVHRPVHRGVQALLDERAQRFLAARRLRDQNAPTDHDQGGDEQRDDADEGNEAAAGHQGRLRSPGRRRT